MGVFLFEGEVSQTPRRKPFLGKQAFLMPCSSYIDSLAPSFAVAIVRRCFVSGLNICRKGASWVSQAKRFVPSVLEPWRYIEGTYRTYTSPSIRL